MNAPDYQSILEEITNELRSIEDTGTVANYIPELARVNSDKLGVSLITVEGKIYNAGDYHEPFSIQSISKVLSLTLALRLIGDKLWQRVGVEPSGSEFDSLVQLDYEKGFPRNPLINAGAIVVCDVLLDCLKDPKKELLLFLRSATSLNNLAYCTRVAESEKRHGFKNRAVANLLKGYGNLKHSVDAVLDLYFYLCSIEMTCTELTHAFLFLASDGMHPSTGTAVVNRPQSKRINAIMQMCGFYDEAGDFAFKVGLPGKSGVGGGIVAVHPAKYSVAVWSPKLNKKGNSYKGVKMLEAITSRVESSIF